MGGGVGMSTMVAELEDVLCLVDVSALEAVDGLNLCRGTGS